MLDGPLYLPSLFPTRKAFSYFLSGAGLKLSLNYDYLRESRDDNNVLLVTHHTLR